MKLLDANLLIYAVNSQSAVHKQARTWLEKALSGQESVAFSPTILLAFLRLTTRPGIFAHSLPVSTAFDVIDQWLSQPCTVVLEPGPRHWQILRSLLLPLGTAGNLTADAHLAALAMEFGCVLYTNDHDFDRFPGLKVQYPLAIRKR